MDAYLESLVRKENVASDIELVDAESEKIDSVDGAVTEIGSEEPLEQTVDDSTLDSEVTIEEGAELKTNIEETDSLESVKEEKSNEGNEEYESPVIGPELEIGQIVLVTNIRVYKTPDVKQMAKIVSGNVTYLGTIGDFNIVSYMRHGFGIVKGYTLDSLI